MTPDEFFSTLKAIPVIWVFGEKGDIRSKDGYTPLEQVCYFKGGTVSWLGGRVFRPTLIEDFAQQGKILGLPEPFTHALFRVSERNIPADQQSDYEIRQKLIDACRRFA